MTAHHRRSTLLFGLLGWGLLGWGLSACSAGTSGLEDAGPVPCTNNDQCSAAEWCSGGFCTPGSGNECTSDEACGVDRVCQQASDCGATRCSGNVCVAKPCAGPEDCDGLCLDGLCAPAPSCTDGGSCPDPLICEDGLCVPPQTMSCTDDGDCPVEGEICVLGQCGPPVACTTSSDCPSDQRCIQGVCNDPCQDAAECGNPAPAFRCDMATGECQQRCLQSGMCPENQVCNQGLCVPAECTQDQDCDLANNEICQGADTGRGRCVQITPCAGDGSCPEGTLCNPGTNRCDPLPGCRTDRDCGNAEYCERGYCRPSTGCATTPCPTDQSCVAEVCVPFTCRGNADCTAQGEICLGGRCGPPPSSDFVVEVRIITPAGTVRPGSTYGFVALALDQAGRVVPGAIFDWTSTSTSVAFIDAGGLATGGATPGTTQIRASLDTAGGRITSSPVNLINLRPLGASEVRVTVVRLATGAPIANAQVELSLSTGGSLSAVTDASGQALFTPVPNGAFSVTAAHPDHDYLSVLAQTGRDLLLPLPPLHRPDRAAGARGTVDLSQVSTQGAIALSLSGASLPSPLFAFDASSLFGGELFQVQVPMLGNVPVPAANTISAEFMGFPIDLKDTYYASAEAGTRALYSFGGRIELGANGLSPADLGNILTAVLPFYQRFDHAVRPVVPLLALPTVVDTIDIDGDGDTSELVADWAGFGTFAMTPSTPQSLRYQLEVDHLPFVSGGNANTLIVLAGVLLPGVGLVPLGLDGQSDQQGNGVVERFVSKMAPPHDGLEVGDYVILASASRTAPGGLPGPASTRLFVSSQLPTAVDLSDGWLDAPVDAVFAPLARRLELPLSPGVDLYHAVFQSPNGAWHVYTDAPVSESVIMPAAPAGALDRVGGGPIALDGIELVPGQSSATLFDAAAGGALALDRATRGFARTQLP